MRRDYYHLSLAVGAVWAALGCRSVDAPSAVVIPSVIAPDRANTAWLESATLVCRLPVGSSAPSPAAADVAPASFSADAADVVQPAASSPPAELIRVLAIRYPHPDGRRDVARAELVVADPAAAARDAGSWRSRFASTAGGILPGVAWGPGIRRAVGLDVPVGELQAIIAAAQQPAAAGAIASTAFPIEKLQVNGQPLAVSTVAPPQLQQLVELVAQNGRVISYRGSAADLLTAAATAP